MTMAEHPTHSDLEAHRETYRGFIRGCIAVVLHATYVLVALASVGFGSTLPVFLAFAGLALGTIAIIVDLRSGSKAWALSLGLLVVFALVTAINV